MLCLCKFPSLISNIYECKLLAASLYVNSSCWCGPYLDSRKVSELPTQFGPGTINRVMRESIQSLVDCALDQKQIFGMLRQGDGKVIITGILLLYIDSLKIIVGYEFDNIQYGFQNS